MEIAALPANKESLTAYSAVSISFEVRSKLTPIPLDDSLGGIVLREEEVIPPYTKDYDEAKGEGPLRWLERFNTANWVVFLAREAGVPVGGAAVAFRTPEVHMLRGRDDMAVLWDIRVHPDHRRSGIGRALFAEAARWSREMNCKYLKAETQNVNVPACRFLRPAGLPAG
jgi:GNAT superfamily N-acetyltransferase